MVITYGLFLGCIFTVYHFVAEGQFSSILTMSAMFQCLAMLLLGLQVVTGAGLAGISARSLGLEALAFCLRLASTTWLNGYLPMDATGDHLYQAVDVCSLLLAAWLLREVLARRRPGGGAEAADALPVAPMVVGSVLLAALLHADMNSYPLFDVLWMASLFLGVVSVLPQLWLISQTGGVVHACTSHYIAMMAVSRVLSGCFMWHARHDITCPPWIEGINHASWAILAAHALHLILLADFAYYYVKAVVAQGLACQIDFRDGAELV